MNAKLIKLSFVSPVHFGAGRLTDAGFACDAGTLFSALYIEAMRMGLADDLLEAATSGEFFVSDAFPYTTDALYLPKPLLRVESLRGEASSDARADSRERKAAKRLGYVPFGRFDDYLAGRFDFAEELGRFKLGASSLQTKVNLMREGSADAEPYHVGGFRFEKGAGLYFIVVGSFAIDVILESLAYAGIGGKRSSGYGRFEYEPVAKSPLLERVKASPPDEGGRFMLLSTAAPTDCELDEQLLSGARYKVVRKGGFVQSDTHARTPQKKRDLYAFAAGSVFSRAFSGDVFDVNMTKGSHPVYRYARALWMEV